MVDVQIKAPEREYFDAFGLVALCVMAAGSGQPCMIGATTNLAVTLQQAKQQWHWSVEYAAIYWVKDEISAGTLINAVYDRVPSDDAKRIDISADEIIVLVEQQAARHAVVLTPHDLAIMRVRLALAHVDAVIEDANNAGKLKWFNIAYHDYRTHVGAMAMSYQQARLLLRAAMVKRLAANPNSQVLPDLLAEIGLEPVRLPKQHRLKAIKA